MDTRLKISEFARLTGVPQKTLRYYDEIGLFPPAEVDPANGYRYYTPDQLPRLNQIMLYRSLGFPLEHIQQLIQAGTPPEQLRGMLRMRQEAARAQLEEAQQRVEALEASLAETDAQVEFEARVAGYEVQVKAIEPVRVAAMRGESSSLAACGQELTRLSALVFKHIYRHRARPAAPGIALYHLFTETRVELEFAQPIAGELPATPSIGVYELPGVAQAACVTHRGPLAEIEYAHAAIWRWLEREGYRVNGPVRDVYLRYDPSGDPAEYLVELQYPIEKGGE